MKEQSQNSPSSEFLKTDKGKTKSNAIEIPSISVPKGGGALKGIDEKFQVNAANGTASFSIPLPFAQARGASPSLALSYNSGAGNGIFGLGWNLNISSIKRKTDKKLPEYLDAIDSDAFLFSEAEDLVPEFKKESDGSFSIDPSGNYVLNERNSVDGLFQIRFYKPRIEGLFSRIERWTEISSGIIKWRITSKENVTTLFGWTSGSVISDPNDNSRIFEWLPEFVFDDKGNCSRYIYKKEDNSGFDPSLLHNKNRHISGNINYTNLYLEKVLYGNKVPYKKFRDPFPVEGDFFFVTVLDYGEYDDNSPYSKIKNWAFRADAFSDYKSGFEIRTTRLCKRVLLFHRFEANEYSGLVRSLNFKYDTVSQQDFTFLTGITSFGYIRKMDGSYSDKKLPTLEFQYQKHDWNQEVKTISRDDLTHAPSGLDESTYQFTDLFNEGLSGILSEQSGGWFYKRNLGEGKFAQAELVTPKPTFQGLGSLLHLADLDANGGKQLVNYSAEPKGYFELDDDNNWQNFQSFSSLPNINFQDPNLRMLDLNGDGKADILITEDNVFTWYPSQGKEGYSEAFKTVKPYDEEVGPRVVFADGKQSIFLSDMTGDGMIDIVRIRNGEVCYWPNLGYGKFGSRVAMDNAPSFDSIGSFDPAYLRLADIDGSGTTDIIYLGKNKFSCWLNLSGNSFSTTPWDVNAFPSVDNQSRITVLDLLGNGVSCIIWSSGLSKDFGGHIKYIDLMNSKKPHVMVFYKNNLGKEVTIEYSASTKFYLEDKLAGNPWITKLHFPVQCITGTETRDKITGWKFTSRYKYHHGYYDHAEREFRGFGMVEQSDSENFEHWEKSGATNISDAELHQAPVVSKTWFHTGAFLRKEKILTHFEGEYWYEEMQKKGFPVTHNEADLNDAQIVGAPGIQASILSNLSVVEWREALRACKSMTLRSEVFALDAPEIGATNDEIKKQLTPFTVATHNCLIELLQPKGQNQHAIFTVKENEAITYNYERNIDDPRIAHNLNIKLDVYGNILESVAVVYPRLVTDSSLPSETQAAQNKTVIIYTQNTLTNDVISDEVFRLRLPSETRTFELKGVSKTSPFYSPSDFTDILLDANSDVALYHEFEKPLNAGRPQRRMIEHIRSVYYKNDLTGPLTLSLLESRAIPFQSYQLAYTPELLTDIFGPINLPGSKVTDALMTEGRFLHSEGDNNWWIRSGTTQFISGAETDADAQDRFFAPLTYTDPFGAVTKVKYYGSYFLFVNETEDAIGNKSSVEVFNFRTLSPQRIKDINNNLSESISDELGLVKATAVFGKGSEADGLTGITEVTDTAEKNLITNFLNVTDIAPGITDSVTLTNIAKQLLNHASGRFIYDLDQYKASGKPVVVASILREEHYQKNNNSPIQLSFEYSGGLGEVVMKKTQAEPGLAKRTVVTNNTYAISTEDTDSISPKQLRWLGMGRTVVNNKGSIVKQYEPYFSVTYQHEDLKELVESGVTPIMHYDALGRLIRTENPDGTFTKVEFNSWKTAIYDANDNILSSSWYNNRTNSLINAELIAQDKDPVKEKAAADKAAKHADTPNILHFDTLGRPVLSIDFNKNISTEADEFYRTKIHLDVEGNLRSVNDARELVENANKGNTVAEYKYDMLGDLVYQKAADSGKRWLLSNVLGNPLRTWDERNHEFQYFYDTLHRPLQSKVIGGDGIAPLDNVFDRTFYGESEPNPEIKNLRGKVIAHYDTGGLVSTPEFDFSGQPKSTTRSLFKKYKSVANWIDANLLNDLENDAFTFSTEADALGRISRQIAPDLSVITPVYNEAGLLSAEKILHNGSMVQTDYIKEIDYNEKGQRSKIIYGNNVITKFHYDRETYRLIRLETKRQNTDPLQDWYYTYDAAGNITHIEDKNIPVTFFDNNKTTGVSEYTYDALYRLAEASGRENKAALVFNSKDNWNDAPFIHQLSSGDAMAIRSYTQNYQYDEAGNIRQIKHQAIDNNWTRNYDYEKLNNRLKNTTIGAETYNYSHHAQHGFMLVMPHLEEIGWSFKEELVKSIKQKVSPGNGTAETTYYQYDGGGKRIRKITENFASPGSEPTKKDERIYISGYETYRTYQANVVNFERESLSLLDQGHRFVVVETVKQNTKPTPPVSEIAGARLIRYQLHNHIGSAALELDEAALVISYEEYHPFGTTAFQANNTALKAAAKRYRYTGMERDEETGLEYHSARYYLPWLGRWLNPDPIGIQGGTNVYCYCKGNPVSNADTNGKQSDSSTAFGVSIGGGGVSIGAFPVSLPPDPNRSSYVLALGRAGMGPGSYMDRAEANTGLWAINIQDTITLRRDMSLGRPLTMHFPTGPAMERVFATPGRPDGGGLFPMFSGVMVQEVLEGNQAGTVHADMRGITLTPRLSPGTLPGMSPDDFHSSAEARQVIAHLASTGPGERAVDIVIQHEEGISTIPRDANRVSGAPLPSRLADRVPNISNDPDPGPPPPPPVRTAPAVGTGGGSRGTGGTGGSRGTGGGVVPRGGGGTGGRGSMGNAAATGLATVVPGASEALVVADAIAPVAARLGMGRLATAAFAGARAPGPAVVGGLVGAPAGVVAESVARDAGLSEGASTAVGLGTAVATGAAVAAVGVLLVATAPVSLAVIGGAALVGGLAAGFGYLMSRAAR